MKNDYYKAVSNRKLVALVTFNDQSESQRWEARKLCIAELERLDAPGVVSRYKGGALLTEHVIGRPAPAQSRASLRRVR